MFMHVRIRTVKITKLCTWLNFSHMLKAKSARFNESSGQMMMILTLKPSEMIWRLPLRFLWSMSNLKSSEMYRKSMTFLACKTLNFLSTKKSNNKISSRLKYSKLLHTLKFSKIYPQNLNNNSNPNFQTFIPFTTLLHNDQFTITPMFNRLQSNFPQITLRKLKGIQPLINSDPFRLTQIRGLECQI